MLQRATHPLAERPVYSRDQLARYVERLHKNATFKYTLDDLEAEIQADPLAALANLQRKQLSVVSFGNVALHYSQHRSLSLDHDALYVKIVERGLGGYCMENNSFFATILRSLGYDLYITGARISNGVDMNGRDPEGFGGWEHMVILAIINGKKYHVDVGFGSQGALSPILLKDDETVESVPGLQGRLRHRPIVQNVDTSQKLWVFEIRNVTDDVWRPAYCFSEIEFHPLDFEIINYRTSHDPLSWFTYRLVLTRVLLDETHAKAIGTITLMGETVTKRIGGEKSETLVQCTSEQERVDALEKYFDIVLRPEEKNGIVGMATYIRPPMPSI